MFTSGVFFHSAARLAQSVEHQTFNLRVKGSSPLMGYSFLPSLFFIQLFKKTDNKTQTSQGGLEPPTFRLTVERDNWLRTYNMRTDNRGISTERRFKGPFRLSAAFFIYLD